MDRRRITKLMRHRRDRRNEAAVIAADLEIDLPDLPRERAVRRESASLGLVSTPVADVLGPFARRRGLSLGGLRALFWTDDSLTARRWRGFVRGLEAAGLVRLEAGPNGGLSLRYSAGQDLASGTTARRWGFNPGRLIASGKRARWEAWQWTHVRQVKLPDLATCCAAASPARS